MEIKKRVITGEEWEIVDIKKINKWEKGYRGKRLRKLWIMDFTSWKQMEKEQSICWGPEGKKRKKAGRESDTECSSGNNCDRRTAGKGEMPGSLPETKMTQASFIYICFTGKAFFNSPIYEKRYSFLNFHIWTQLYKTFDKNERRLTEGRDWGSFGSWILFIGSPRGKGERRKGIRYWVFLKQLWETGSSKRWDAMIRRSWFF